MNEIPEHRREKCPRCHRVGDCETEFLRPYNGRCSDCQDQVRYPSAINGAPFRGICLICKKPVYHAYPWWNKNPDTHKDARPIHEGECFAKWNMPPETTAVRKEPTEEIEAAVRQAMKIIVGQFQKAMEEREGKEVRKPVQGVLTPEQLADRAMSEAKHAGARCADEGGKLREIILKAIKEAVEVERERCASLAENYIGPTDRLCLRIGADIRNPEMDGRGNRE